MWLPRETVGSHIFLAIVLFSELRYAGMVRAVCR